MIYLDSAANTKVDKRVLKEFLLSTLKYYANPNSSHNLGKKAAREIEKCSKKVNKYLCLNDAEIIYTSGATESNNLAIKGILEQYKNQKKRIITTMLEHSSIIAPINYYSNDFEVDIVPILDDGQVDLKSLKKLLTKDTILVSICSVDSELGIRQPIEEISEMLKKYNCFFHTDASQAIGKVKIDYKDVDLITIAPHKFYSLNGFGALIKKKEITLKPIILGGHSTTKYRSGTPVTASVIAMTKAIEIATKKLDKRRAYVNELKEMVLGHFHNIKRVKINSTEYSIPNTLNFSIDNVNAKEFAKLLEKKGVYISTQSACSIENKMSNAVYAVTKNESLAEQSLRISFSHQTKIREVKKFIQIFDEIIKEL